MVWFIESPESQGINHPEFHNSHIAKMCTYLSHGRGPSLFEWGRSGTESYQQEVCGQFCVFLRFLSMEQFRSTAMENHTSCPWLSSTFTLFFRKLRAVKLLYFFRLWADNIFFDNLVFIAISNKKNLI